MARIADQQFITRKIDTLIPHPDNPRRGTLDKIAESIDSNGFYGAICIQKSTNYILAGNHRYLAARDQGLNELPVIEIDCDEKTATRILLADNKTSDDATYDDRDLLELLKSVDAMDDLYGTAYSNDELLELIAKLEELPKVTRDPDDVPSAPKETVSKLGDLWILGHHRVLCGDSTSVEAMDKVLDGEKVDLV